MCDIERIMGQQGGSSPMPCALCPEATVSMLGSIPSDVVATSPCRARGAVGRRPVRAWEDVRRRIAKSYRNLVVLASPRAGSAPQRSESFADDSRTSLLSEEALQPDSIRRRTYSSEFGTHGKMLYRDETIAIMSVHSRHDPSTLTTFVKVCSPHNSSLF